MQLIERWTVTGSAANSHTFSGLDGDTDINWKMIFMVKGAVVSMHTILYFNADTTASNYRRRYWVNAGGGTDQSFGGLGLTSLPAIGDLELKTLDIYAKSGNYRQAFLYGVAGVDASAVDEVGQIGGVWYNTVDNITSITVTSNVTNGFAVGTDIALYRVSN